MSDPLTRFSNRAENYAKYRPNYPAETLAVLKRSCGLSESAVIADIGSGTGISSELFLKQGNMVYGVEPNEAMRASAEQLLSSYRNFVSVNGAAEATRLENHSVDFVIAAQAFHWFNRVAAKNEFARVLKPRGWVVLIWNERRLDTTPFLRAYEELLLQYGVDYQTVRHENVADEIADFFAPEPFALETLENAQHFDFEALTGRLLSSSYVPDASQATFKPMLATLEEIFSTNQRNGLVSFDYETKIYFGHVPPPK